MSIDWKYYEVNAELSWMSGGDLCEGNLTVRIHAKSPGHAISRVKDRLEDIGRHDVDEIEASEVINDE